MVDLASSRPRVLIADDEEKLRGALVNMLEVHGFQVIGAAANGAQAIAMSDATRPDLILLDYTMPGINGVGVIEHVKAQNPNTQIVVFTVHDESSLSLDVTKSGAFAFLVKGSPPALLLEVLNRAWERKQAIDRGVQKAG
jgi:DNA-binding NarL/FixJ family response regulator